uniref:Uncharacterized protein n=1 Tax=Rangifer tarandus platyrhynchus TaxID=3082113 RepID=A0ACB0E529_RANTA|nr:unnamed protein product [Rangifer tarandus platyrhynchus]
MSLPGPVGPGGLKNAHLPGRLQAEFPGPDQTDLVPAPSTQNSPSIPRTQKLGVLPAAEGAAWRGPRGHSRPGCRPERARERLPAAAGRPAPPPRPGRSRPAPGRACPPWPQGVAAPPLEALSDPDGVPGPQSEPGRNAGPASACSGAVSPAALQRRQQVAATLTETPRSAAPAPDPQHSWPPSNTPHTHSQSSRGRGHSLTGAPCCRETSNQRWRGVVVDTGRRGFGLVQARRVLPRPGKGPRGPSLPPASEQSRSQVGQVGGQRPGPSLSTPRVPFPQARASSWALWGRRWGVLSSRKGHELGLLNPVLWGLRSAEAAPLS